MALNDLRISTFIIVASIVLFGTFYSIANKTWLDTSDPLLTHLAHPLQASHYFANKKNPLNVYFIKKAWAWCTLAFLGLFLTDPSDFSAPQRRTRLTKWAVETAVFIAFASWFFGPPLLDRLLAVSGGECVLVLPTGYVIRELPLEYCYSGAHVSPATHPGLFSATLLVPETAEWKARPRLRRGHDISGHVFLLTMGVLFLMDQMRMSLQMPRWPSAHRYAYILSLAVVGTSLLALYTTSVYFHTPGEKFSGLILGVFGFLVCQLPWFEPEPLWRPTSAPHHVRQTPAERRREVEAVRADVVMTAVPQ